VAVSVDRIFREWDALCYSSNPEMAAAEREERARALHDSCMYDGNWIVPVSDAALATYHVVVWALQAERYDETVEYCLQYFSHSDAAIADESDRDEFTVFLGSAYVLKGDIEIGLKTYRDLIQSRKGLKQHRRRLVRNNLITVLEKLGRASEADDRILDFGFFLLRWWKGQTRKRADVLKARTYGDVCDILMSTFREKA